MRSRLGVGALFVQKNGLVRNEGLVPVSVLVLAEPLSSSSYVPDSFLQLPASGLFVVASWSGSGFDGAWEKPELVICEVRIVTEEKHQKSSRLGLTVEELRVK